MIQPTESELAILQVLWKKGASSVREVHEELAQKKDVGYTTTLKIMQIMLDKGLLSRDSSKRSHIYNSIVREKDIKGTLLNQFMKNTFHGSAAKLILQALGNHKMSETEIREIKELIKQIENKQNGNI